MCFHFFSKSKGRILAELRVSFKSTYFKKYLRTTASDISYILHKKLNKIIQEPNWLSVSFWNIKSLYFTYYYSYSFVLSLTVIRCHSLSFFCHSLSLVVIRSITRCQSLYHSLPLVVIRCNTCCHSLPPVVIRCTARWHLLSLLVPLACLFINDLFVKQSIFKFLKELRNLLNFVTDIFAPWKFVTITVTVPQITVFV